MNQSMEVISLLLPHAPLDGFEAQRGLLYDAGTPYGIGFVDNEEIFILRRDPAIIVFNATQIRFVSDYQIDAFVDTKPDPNPSEVLERYVTLRSDILAAPNCMLVAPYPVVPLPTPKRFPTQFRGNPIVVARNSPAIMKPGWMMDWMWWATGRFTIYTEQDMAEAMAVHPDPDPTPLSSVLHEWIEPRLSMMFAQAIFPGMTMAQYAGLALILGGLGHHFTLPLVDGYSDEGVYFDKIDKQRTLLGLPILNRQGKPGRGKR